MDVMVLYQKLAYKIPKAVGQKGMKSDKCVGLVSVLYLFN